MPPANDTPSTQLDRILAVLLVLAALAVIVWLVYDGVDVSRIAIVSSIITVLVLPVAAFLLARQWGTQTRDALDRLHTTTETIATQTNGVLAAKLDTQTEQIVARVLAAMDAAPTPRRAV